MWFCTVDVDSGGVVVDPGDIFSQAAVVAHMIQTNPLNMKTAVLPHFYILVCGHLKKFEGRPSPPKNANASICVLTKP